MSITQITEREQKLTHYLAEMTKALELMRQERDEYLNKQAAENKALRDALEQINRESPFGSQARSISYAALTRKKQ
jgi:hypothetical protein